MDFVKTFREKMSDPGQLELLYREKPEQFKAAFDTVFMEQPDSLVLQVWKERLYYQSEIVEAKVATRPGQQKQIWLVIVLAVLAGIVLKSLMLANDYWPGRELVIRNLAFIFLPFIVVYFLSKERPKRSVWLGIIAAFLLSLGYINLLPDRNGQTLWLAVLHLPLMLWGLTGVAYMGEDWRSPGRRMNYLVFNGEVALYSLILMVGGAAFTLVSIFLFDSLNGAEKFYTEYVGVFGAAAVPVVATYLSDVRKNFLSNLLPVLARIFSPMFLATVVLYLTSLFVAGYSPYNNRDFLLTINVLLIVVLALITFMISGRKKELARNWSDYTNFALCVLTGIVDLIALSAILFRFASYGLTPNRLAVLGANILIFVHLAGVIYFFARFLWKGESLARMEEWMTRYLTVYFGWTTLVAFGFPLIFWFG